MEAAQRRESLPVEEGRAESKQESTVAEVVEAGSRLRSARTLAARLQGGRELLEAARGHCAGTLDIGAVTEAGEALGEALAGAEGADRESLATLIHDFIDLARWPSVRRAAFPADADRPGGRWLDTIIRLIDEADFTVGRMFRQRAAQYPDKTLFIVPSGELVREYSWRQVARTTEQIAGGVLGTLGADPRVAIFSPNRVAGALCDLACLSNGIFNTMIAANATEAQLEHILLESGARMLVVSGGEQLQKGLAAHEKLPSLEWVMTLDELPSIPGARVMTLDQLIDRGKEVPRGVLEERATRVRSRDLATTMYTSGTTGTPKGIKFSHLNLVSKRFARATALPDIDDTEVFLCYLPLYHTFGRWLEMLAAVHLAGVYIFAESASIETLVQHMRRFQPTAMIGVPKKWIDLHRRIVATDEPPDDPDKVRRAINEVTGGRLRWGLSAAGRLDPTIFRFFQNNGIELLSGYGMTEATGGITMTPPGRYVDESIGKALPGIELGFADDGELLLRGPYVTSGYTDPQDEATAFKDGWFCTGDIVSQDSAGYLKHVDRKKDIYKNASGRTVAPQRVEGLFADFPEVSRVFAVGDGREYVTLLLRPNLDFPEVSFATMSPTAAREYFRELVATCNRFLAPFERVVNFALLDRDFSAEHGELTPKGSFRRSAVEQNFRHLIEPMYASSSVERVVEGMHVKVPIAFLQHLGATETGTRADENGLEFKAVDRKLGIRRDTETADRIWIGNCCYDGIGKVVDLDDWLRLPQLWVGNAELTHITGDNILLWSLSAVDRATRSRMVRMEPPQVPIDEWRNRLDASRDTAVSLLTVHAAAVALSGGSREVALRAVDHLAYAMTAGRVRYQELAESHLQHASQHAELAVRSRAFVALLEHQPVDAFSGTAALFCESQLDFLDEEACARIAEIGVDSERWQRLSRAFSSLRQRVTRAESARTGAFAIRLCRALGRIADLQEDFYIPARRELLAWLLAPVAATIRDAAGEILEAMTSGFRRRFEREQLQATDPQTGREYGWAEAIQFEDGIDPQERDRIAEAVRDTELVREAVYLLHQKRQISLTDLAPRSIWISLVGTRFGRSIYHVGVRLRSLERCDFAIHVRNTASAGTFLTDLQLMGVAAGGPGEAPLTPQLGGYWADCGIATAEHPSGESVETVARHMHEHPDHDIRVRLRNAWQHLCWSALTAAFEFHRRTEGQWVLAGTVARDISVPLNDFEENTRIFSAAGWQRFNGTLDLILKLKRAFLDRVRFHYPALAAETHDKTLFAAAIEANGLPEGLALLRNALDEAKGTPASDDETAELCRGMNEYVERVEESGYVPKSLHFAIARYRTWSKQVPDADLHARAAQLRELQNNYRIEEVRRRFPGSRLRLYAKTVLENSPPEGRAIIEQAIHRLREGADIKEVLGHLYTELQEKLPSHDQHYFLTRAAYPHLELDEKAQLITTAEVGPDRAELVTLHRDRTGRELRVRPAANSHEVDALHRVFYIGGLGGGLTVHERLLVAVDQMSHVVGGVGYIRRTPSHVLLDKIAVLPRCRGRGIGQVLVHEFLRRQSADGVAIISAEFIRAGWLGQFGFGSHPRYAGVVLPLTEQVRPTSDADRRTADS